jgi:hypothetical protein
MKRRRLEPGLRAWIETTAAEALADPDGPGGNLDLQRQAVAGLKEGNPEQAQLLQRLGLLEKWAVATEYSMQKRTRELREQGYGPDAAPQAMLEWYDFQEDPEEPLPFLDQPFRKT